MNSAELRQRTRNFAIRTVKAFRALPRTPDAQIMGKQLLRAATSAAANYRAACRGRSKAEFFAKLCIVVEEMDETLFWMDLLVHTGSINANRMAALQKEAEELTSIFASARKTMRTQR